jgi:hypothetical protein
MFAQHLFETEEIPSSDGSSYQQSPAAALRPCYVDKINPHGCS